MNEKILEEYSVRIYEIGLYFMSITKKKVKVDKKGANTYYLDLMSILMSIFSRRD